MTKMQRAGICWFAFALLVRDLYEIVDPVILIMILVTLLLGCAFMLHGED